MPVICSKCLACVLGEGVTIARGVGELRIAGSRAESWEIALQAPPKVYSAHYLGAFKTVMQACPMTDSRPTFKSRAFSTFQSTSGKLLAMCGLRKWYFME